MNTTALTPRFSGQAIPSTLLNDLVNRQATGKLTVQNPFDELVNWQVYLGNGKIHFANSATGPEERLNYLMGNHLNKRKITLPPKIHNDYDYLCGSAMTYVWRMVSHYFHTATMYRGR